MIAEPDLPDSLTLAACAHCGNLCGLIEWKVEPCGCSEAQEERRRGTLRWCTIPLWVVPENDR